MIRVEFSLAISLYLMFSVIGILALWVYAGRNKKYTRVNPEEKFVWQCPICTYFYVDSRNEEISACPRCGSYNSRKKH